MGGRSAQAEQEREQRAVVRSGHGCALGRTPASAKCAPATAEASTSAVAQAATQAARDQGADQAPQAAAAQVTQVGASTTRWGAEAQASVKAEDASATKGHNAADASATATHVGTPGSRAAAGAAAHSAADVCAPLG